MSLKGTFSNVYKGYTYQISWTASQSVSTNTSTITCTHKLICASGYSLSIGKRSNTCKVNDDSKSFTSNSINTSGGSTITLGTTTHTVKHSSDGSGEFSIVCTFNIQATISGKYVDSIVVTGTATLDSIARSSEITAVVNITLGNKCNVTWTPANVNFKYKIQFVIGDWLYTTDYISPNTTSSYQYTDYTISGEIKQNNTTIYEELPNSTSGEMSAILFTYDSNNVKIGDSSPKMFTVSIPSTIKPTIGSIILTPQTYDYLIQGKNKLKISADACSAGLGSSIKSYTFSGVGISTTTTSSSVISSSNINPGGSSDQTLTYTVKVTDSRGRSTSQTATIKCYTYFAPYIKSLTACRVDSDGNIDSKGTLIKCSYDLDFASIDNSNRITVTLMHKKATASEYLQWQVLYNDEITSGNNTLGLNNPISIDTTYSVYMIITDRYNGKSSSDVITVFGQERIINITSDGTGIAIGKMAESSQLFECRWNAKFDGTASGPSGFSTSSDERVKKNIQDIDIDIVDKLRPVQYELIQATDGKTHYGFVAQEVENLLSSIGLNPASIGVIGEIMNNNRQEYVLTYTEFIPLLTKKCQDLQKEVDLLRQEIAKLKNFIA